MWGAIIGGGLSLAGSLFGSDRSSDSVESAARQQAALTREGLDLQREMFETQREDMLPWREVGEQALQRLQQGVAEGRYDPSNFNFEADPGYQFRLQEGTNALNASASARGRLLSGEQLKALQRYGQGMASQEYGNAFNRNMATQQQNYNQLAGLSGTGQTAASQMAGYSGQMAGNIGNAFSQMGQAQYNAGAARATGYQNMAGSLNQGIGNMLFLNRLNQIAPRQD